MKKRTPEAYRRVAVQRAGRGETASGHAHEHYEGAPGSLAGLLCELVRAARLEALRGGGAARQGEAGRRRPRLRGSRAACLFELPSKTRVECQNVRFVTRLVREDAGAHRSNFHQPTTNPTFDH